MSQTQSKYLIFVKSLLSKNGLALKGNYLEFSLSTPNFQLLPNFKLHDFLTKNQKDTYTKININIVCAAQDIRDHFGSGVGVSSSYRSPSYNKSQKGATASEHILGNALDIYPINGNVKKLKESVKEIRVSGGIGFYKTFVHIDEGKKRFWNG